MYFSFILKKKIALSLFLVFLLGIGIFLYLEFIHIPSHSTDMEFRVAIDPGHGSIDTGTHYNQIYEKNINLSIAKILAEELKKLNIIPIMTRKEDKLYQNSRRKDLRYRPSYANQNKADLFVSIHVNNFPSSAPAGSQIFYKSGSIKSKLLAELIKQELIKLRNENNRATGPGNYYVLNKADCPAVLIETGFLSNPKDRNLLIKSKYQNKLAVSIKEGILRYFQENLKTEMREANKGNENKEDNNSRNVSAYANLKLFYLKSIGEKFNLTETNYIYPTGSFLNTNLTKYNLKEFIALSSITQLLNPPSHLISPLPEGTKVLSIKVENSKVIVNFSKEIKENFNGGANLEQLTVTSIKKTLCSIPEIKGVNILIEGKYEQSIGGHIILSSKNMIPDSN